jgi:hypothetical protein
MGTLPPVSRFLSLGIPVFALVLALGGCATDQGTLLIAATRPVQFDLRDVDVAGISVHREVTGSDTRVTSVLFLPTAESPRLERAVEEALVAGGGDVMARVRVRTIDWWFLVGVSTVQVRGDVVDLTGGP